VLNQSYGDWEIILVDDCSSDGSYDILKKYARLDSRFRVYQNSKNKGQGLTRNFAIKQAKGTFIAFLDSDDIWHCDKLAIQITAMQTEGHLVCHTSYGYIDKNGNILKSPLRVTPKVVTYKMLLRRTEMSCLTVIYNADKLGKRYMPNLPRSQDYALWLELLRSCKGSFGIDTVLASYRLHENNISKNKFKKISHHWHVLYRVENLPLFTSVYFTIRWAINGISRYF